jgi:hypothetical protein
MKSPLAFYTLMQYPEPIAKVYFYYKKKVTAIHTIDQKIQTPTIETQKKIDKIKKYKRLRKHIPYIHHIYICDSISFNASNTWSDIDLFFITKSGCIRRARLWTVLIFWILGIKRTLEKKSWFFDLVFYIDEQHSNIEYIALKNEDIYLSYRLAHLIPIYQYKPYNIYTHNKRIQKTLPNFPMKHIPQLEITIEKESSRYKRIIEKICWNKPDNLLESAIKHIRKPIVIRKKKIHKSEWRWIVITDIMLKFHKDKRKDIQKKWETLVRKEKSC